MNGTSETVDFSSASAIRAACSKCRFAEKVSMVNRTVFHLSGKEHSDVAILYFLQRPYLAVCLSIERSGLNRLYVDTTSLMGQCEGPKLIFFDNPRLEDLTLNPDFMKELKSMPNAFRVRGNRMLGEKSINSIKEQADSHNVTLDLQTVGECVLPKPFVSFEALDRTCNKFYGVLALEQDVAEIWYDLEKVHSFEVEACIQIENTNLKDITFLHGFSRFKPIPFCSQYVKNNRNLCSKNLNYFNVYFKNVAFFNNSNLSCNECMGGPVSEQYLSDSANCSLIYGDLIIAHLRGLPRDIDNLRTIETITGRLIISNNTGLGTFMYLASLQNIGTKNENGIAVVVKDNADLQALPMPKLENVMLKKGNKRVELVNNPMLAEEMKKMIEEWTPAIEQTAVQHTVFTAKEVPEDNFGLFCSLVVASVVLISAALYGVRLTFRRKKRILALPELPYNLNSKSQKQLVSVCTEILKKNPIVWCTEDYSLLWNRRSTAVCYAHSSSKRTELIKNGMIPVIRNGNIPRRIPLPQNRPLQFRLEEILEYDLVVTVGTTTNVSDVVPGLPDNVGDLYAYEGGMMYKLLEVIQLSSMSASFKYEVKSRKKGIIKNLELVLFYWAMEKLPTEFSELLQLIKLAKSRRVVCMSNRRKEAFSVLYVFYTNVMEARGPQSAVEVFQLHSQLCNGAPLDRCEMLYVMRILLEWAKGAKCMPSIVEKECSQWCQIYDQMAAFSKKHMNIMNVHPMHLTRLDCLALLNDEVAAARKQLIRLSERPFTMMVDRFRRKTSEEIKRDMLKTTKTITEESKENIDVSVDDNIRGKSTLTFLPKNRPQNKTG